MEKLKNKKNIVIFLLIIALSLVSIYLIKITFKSLLTSINSAIYIVLVPALVALFISYLISPVCDFFEKKLRINKTVSVLITISLTCLAIIGLIVFVAIFLGNIFYDLYINFWPSISSFLSQYIPEDMLKSLEAFLQGITNVVGDIDKSKILEAVLKLLSVASKGIMSFIELMMMCILVPVFLFFLLKEKSRIFKGITHIFPKKYSEELCTIGFRSNEVIEKFFKGRILSMLIMSVLFTIIFYSLGMNEYAILFGFLIGFLDIIPYVGPFIGVVLPVIYSLSIASHLYLGYWTAPLIIALNFVLQFFQQNILQPKIMGKEIEIHPLLIFVSMLFFGQLLGVAGLIVAVPICGIIKVLNEFIREKKLKAEKEVKKIIRIE